MCHIVIIWRSAQEIQKFRWALWGSSCVWESTRESFWTGLWCWELNIPQHFTDPQNQGAPTAQKWRDVTDTPAGVSLTECTQCGRLRAPNWALCKRYLSLSSNCLFLGIKDIIIIYLSIIFTKPKMFISHFHYLRNAVYLQFGVLTCMPI